MPLGATAFTSVNWTVGDVITEAKLDYMTDNDRAYDSHATNGILLNNDKGVTIKDSGGTNREVLNISSGNVLKIGNDSISTVLATGLLNAIYPVGTIYTTIVATNPSSVFGGTWVEFGAGRVLVGRSSGETEFDTVEETGGAKTVTLSTAQIPTHSHAASTALWGQVEGYGQVTVGSTSASNRADIVGGDTSSAGGGGSHNNIQPYIVVYFFKRTA